MTKPIVVTLPINEASQFPFNDSEIEKLKALLELDPEPDNRANRFKLFNDLNDATNDLIKTISEAYDFAAKELVKDSGKSTARIEENSVVNKLIQDSLKKQSDLLN